MTRRISIMLLKVSFFYEMRELERMLTSKRERERERDREREKENDRKRELN